MKVIVNGISHILKIVILIKWNKERLNEHFPVFK